MAFRYSSSADTPPAGLDAGAAGGGAGGAFKVLIVLPRSSTWRSSLPKREFISATLSLTKENSVVI